MDTERLKKLIADRDAIDAEIIALVTGNAANNKVAKERAAPKCSKCGMEGHRASTCTQTELELQQ